MRGQCVNRIGMVPPFESFPSIPRLFRDVVITEKIDGTNASVLEDGRVISASRSRYITPEDDNFGFARWVKDHEEELRSGLGIGSHFGEWWGAGIQRRYGLAEKRWSLFNVAVWGDNAEGLNARLRPSCCHVVPVLYRGGFSTAEVNEQLRRLSELGSIAAPGFMQPEGVVVFHTAGNLLFKATLDKNDGHKGSKSSHE